MLSLLLVLFISTLSFADPPTPIPGPLPGTLLNCPSFYGLLANQIARGFSVYRAAPLAEMKGMKVVTSSSVEDLLGSSSKISPAVDPTAVGFVNGAGPLGYGGVIGPFSPVQNIGPVGGNFWNPSNVISAFDWHRLSDFFTRRGGPLSLEGPLGIYGPEAARAYQEVLPSSFANGPQFQAGGMFGILGPKGIFSPWGLLGPLGPSGAHGFERVPATGAYINEQTGAIVTSIKVRNAQGKLVDAPLFERYNDAYAKQLSARGELDTSFTFDSILRPNQVEKLKMNATGNTWLSIAVIPEMAIDRFTIEVFAEDGVTLIAKADSRNLINFAQIKVPKDMKIQVHIRGSESPYHPNPLMHGNLHDPKYRLIVSESPGEPAELTNLTGPHQTIYE